MHIYQSDEPHITQFHWKFLTINLHIGRLEHDDRTIPSIIDLHTALRNKYNKRHKKKPMIYSLLYCMFLLSL